MPINADFLVRCINTLESACEQLQQCEPSDTLYDIFRAAAVKEFEIILESAGVCSGSDSALTLQATGRQTG